MFTWCYENRKRISGIWQKALQKAIPYNRMKLTNKYNWSEREQKIENEGEGRSKDRAPKYLYSYWR